MKSIAPVVIAGATPFLLLIILGLGLGLGLVSWQPPVFWTTQFGTPNSSNEISALYADTNSVYAAGFAGFHPNPSLSGQPSYLFVNKYGLDGAQTWITQFGNPNEPSNDRVTGVTAGTQRVYVVGTTNSTSFVDAYDLNGNRLWTTQFGNFSDTIVTSVSAGMEGVFVGGYGPSVLGGGGFVRDYAPNGTLLWNRFLGKMTVGPLGVFGDTNGIYATGSNQSSTFNNRPFVSEFDEKGNPIWERWFDNAPATGCTCEPDQIYGDGTNIYIAGRVLGALPGQVSDTRWDTFLRKYDLDGNLLWTVQLGAPDYSETLAPSMSANASGVYLIMITSYHFLI